MDSKKKIRKIKHRQNMEVRVDVEAEISKRRQKGRHI